MVTPTTGNPRLETLITQLSDVRSVEEIEASLLAFLNNFGIKHGFFHAGVLAAPGARSTHSYLSKPLCITALPTGWAEEYATQQLRNADTILTESFRSVTPISWTDVARSPAVDLARDFGMRSGFSIPIHCANGTFGIFGAIMDEDKDETIRFLEAHKFDLFLAAHYIFDAITRLDVDAFPQADLTPRELEILRWAAGGKTSWEIGEILSISERTAENHLRNIREKLGVATKIQAVLAALPKL